MRLKKHLFPYFLVLALLLTVSGLISANISFSAPLTNNSYLFNIVIDNIYSENADVISYDNSNVSYVLELNSIKKEYKISFDVVNDSDFNVVLNNTVMDPIPDELKDLITVDIKTSDSISKNGKDHVSIVYTVKDDLNNNEIKLLDNYKELKVNVIFNYTQE